MELFRTDNYYIFISGEYSLWFDRLTGELTPKTGWDLVSAEDPTCLGVCHGIVGKIESPNVFDTRLIIIKECSPVGHLHGNHVVYKIKSIAFLQLGNENIDLHLQKCHKHKTDGNTIQSFSASTQSVRTSNQPTSLFELPKNSTAFTKTWGALKSAGNTVKNTTQQAAAIATSQVKQTVKRKDNVKDRARFEKRIIDELHKIFTDTDSFYFSRTGDITNSLERQCQLQKEDKIDPKALWKTVDDRFFWNKHMLHDLISFNNSLADPWILPIIQGFVQIEHCKVEVGFDNLGNEIYEPRYETFTLSLISRRSRYRAGTRYKRRGVDDDGYCANYVETEQMVSYHHHQVSFVQVRGSVPIYWSQPGYKYRPPPRLDRSEEETQIAFDKHFNNELQMYGPICIVNLVEQSGKEKVIFDAYSNHVFKYNHKDVTYVTFDFHEYCRGMHFENVSILINAIADVIRDMNYCWKDKEGQICSQTGVFRINCMDCLDRTNVVQTALGKAVMEIQFTKLGLIPPEGIMPASIRNTFQLLWANNGDIISKQYAGTNALKGDYTRTGERKFTGIMKDGVNSANRYYLSRFKDSYRQGTIDIMLGHAVSEDIFSDRNVFEEDSAITAEHVKLLIEDSKKLLISDPEFVLGSWGLIDADPSSGDPMETEMDAILILTKDSYYVADYDEQIDKVTKYQRVLLEDITLLEFGLADITTPAAAISSLFKNSSSARSQHHCIRINYKVANVDGYYHMFRATNLRFFNNMAVVIKNEEEIIESLKAICEAFLVALDICGLPSVPYYQGQKLDRRKSKVIGGSNTYLDVTATLPHLTRNVSETQLLALKTVGTKALSNVSEQFSKLNRFGQNFNTKKTVKSAQAKFTVGKSSTLSSSSNSDSEEDCDISIFQPQEPVTPSGTPLGTPMGNNEIEDNPSGEPKSMSIDLDHLEENEDIHQPLPDTFLPSVGIVMRSHVDGAPGGNSGSGRDPVTLKSKENMMTNDNLSNVDMLSSVIQNVSLQTTSHEQTSFEQNRSPTPEITVTQDNKPPKPPNTLKLDRKLSHSSGEVNDAPPDDSTIGTSTLGGGSMNHVSEQMNISTSQSESALKQHFKSGITNITSPVANVTKDLVLSPFSKIAKGMQHLGANLDPRKIAKTSNTSSGPLVRQITDREYEEHRKLQEKWRKCNTRLIAL
ncbi:phosphatidylinositide phosphatase SAC2 [Chrysoperla carnea]|uniref:phosphatidylinositide phosphatase SAC2 n=1 Tax=Chrysoperla carnea TaxID=189513 RepID=UPI001D064AC9|nr:phosphatidylinositide phosphatase SAC2 [Chrysoperla carnea]